VQALSAKHAMIPMVGASGAVAGVLGAYLITYPRANVHVFVWIVVFFWIVTVPAWILLGFWFGMQLFSGLTTGPGSPGVAFWAHVGGFAAGIGLFLLIRTRRVPLLQPQRTPIWATVPPSALIGRRTFHRGSVPDAEATIRRRHVDYVLICPNYSESTIYRFEAPNGFYAQLAKGNVPAWLQPIPLPKWSHFRMWRVVDSNSVSAETKPRS